MERLRYFAMVLFLLVGMVAAAQTTRIRTQHKVAKGESLATIHAPTMEKALKAAEDLRACCTFSAEPVRRPKLIKDIVL